MRKFYSAVIKLRYVIMAIFIALTAVCAFARQFVAVNYDMNDYLPEDAESSVALDVMGKEFDGEIPNARVMVQNVSYREALEYKEKLEAVEGVSSVTWLDDNLPLDIPIEILDEDTINSYYKDNNALFSVTISEDYINTAVPAIREVIGDENAMTGNAVSTAVATESTVSEISIIATVAVIIVFLILVLSTSSWVEPIVVMLGLGVAILINAGSNIIFGEISFVTNSAGNILQLAVSLDYSVFLIHRFSECKRETSDSKQAMVEALCSSTSSILSSGLTTVIGFLALCLMRFRIGPDLGLALAKGVAISLLTVFLFMPGVILLTFPLIEKTTHKPLLPNFMRFGKAVRKISIPLVAVFVVLIVPSYMASISNDYYYGSSHIFGVGTQYGDDTEKIESIFGESDNYVLMVPKGNETAERNLALDLKDTENITSVTSLTSFLGPLVSTDIYPDAIVDKLESENYRRMVLTVSVPYEGEKTNALIDTIRETAAKYYPDEYYLAGAGVSTYDLQKTVTADMNKVNLVAIGAVFVVLLFTMRSFMLSAVLVLTIETAIWINLSFPFITCNSLFYIAYLIISSIQLGATVDYAILLTERYKENRAVYDKKESVIRTISNVTASILTSATALTVVGFLLGKISTHGLLSQLGYLIGRGTLCSLACVLLVLPGLLYLTDRTFIKKKKTSEITS